ncbi:MAG: hypothetical protein CSA31_02340, partial [Desulfobulbus propionicus]
MSQRMLHILLLTAYCFYATSAAATDQSIHIEWGYTPPSEPAVSGFKLYKEGSAACEIQNPYATSMDCTVSLEQDTTNFTLTALFEDGSESPHSAPFPFILASDEDDDPNRGEEIVFSGSHAFTFSWETFNSTEQISEYKIYLNNSLLCNSHDPDANALTCKTDIINGLMAFTMTTVNAEGMESEPSNVLTFHPNDYPELFNYKSVTFNWEYDDSADITGFKVYQDGKVLCETTDSTATALTCTSNFTRSTIAFAITAVKPDGTETTLSNTIIYTKESTTEPTELIAQISANMTEGTAPLTVSYDASSSTGDIASYAWSFGDGDSSSANNIDHTFSVPGTYQTQLTLTDSDGYTSKDTVTITVAKATVENIPPTAVIVPSAITGEAPVALSFDGSNSSDADGTLTSYSWNFGDGSSASSKKTSHTYSCAGSYTISLTVTDNQGASHTSATIVTITEPAEDVNQPPQAKMTVTSTSGKAPLTISFSATGSSDNDGSIASYSWNFGDGTTSTGISATHTYYAEATYTATLKVTDDKGFASTVSKTIMVEPADDETPFAIEVGEVTVHGSWEKVELEKTFIDPIVIAGPPTYNDSAPGVMRLRNINPTSFEIKFAEWDYLDGDHPGETISFLVIEKGHHNIDGTIIEAGTITGTTRFTVNNFQESFEEAPIVLTTVSSENEQEVIAGRIKNVTTSGFSYYFREQESNPNTHAGEAINYIAWQLGSGSIDTITFEAGNTPDAVYNAWYDITYQNKGKHLPFTFADIQTTDGGDTSSVRMQGSSKTGFQIKVEEEQSKDDEVGHTKEVIGYLALTSSEQAENPTVIV